MKFVTHKYRITLQTANTTYFKWLTPFVRTGLHWDEQYQSCSHHRCLHVALLTPARAADSAGAEVSAQALLYRKHQALLYRKNQAFCPEMGSMGVHAGRQ